MGSKIQILYTQLTQKDRAKANAKILELFAKQQEQSTVEICSNVQRQDDHS